MKLYRQRKTLFVPAFIILFIIFIIMFLYLILFPTFLFAIVTIIKGIKGLIDIKSVLYFIQELNKMIQMKINHFI